MLSQQCKKCNQEVKKLTKTREVLNPNGEKIIIHGVPYENCDCYGDKINIRDAAILEHYAKESKGNQEVSFSKLEGKYKGITFMELIDPNGHIPVTL